jgi:transforming growth factor-beta-induced protein
MKKLFLGLIAVFALSTIGFGQTECSSKTTAKTADKHEVKYVKASSKKGGDIVDTAVGAGMFNTLVAAVKAAGLVETLKGDGPFTVFAPTDEAFAKLPAGTVENLLKPENKDLLVKILTYHVVSGKVMAADVVKLKSAKTVQGQNVSIKVKKGKVMLNKKTNVIKTDITTSNGVIHVIDSVLMPK